MLVFGLNTDMNSYQEFKIRHFYKWGIDIDFFHRQQVDNK